MPQNYYEALGVLQNATQEEIKQAYRKLAKEWHPDINPSLDATIVMQAINVAYEVLSNISLRKAYDIELRNQGRSDVVDVKQSPYSSYTVSREESEQDFEDWVKDYLRTERRKYSNINDDDFIKYDESLFDLIDILNEKYVHGGNFK